jgi:hypothetical protein
LSTHLYDDYLKLLGVGVTVLQFDLHLSFDSYTPFPWFGASFTKTHIPLSTQYYELKLLVGAGVGIGSGCSGYGQLA